jgi:hypothetical protein
MRSFRFNLDALGVCASTLCMVHCLVFTLLLAVLPAWKLSAEAAQRGVEEPPSTANSHSEVLRFLGLGLVMNTVPRRQAAW